MIISQDKILLSKHGRGKGKPKESNEQRRCSVCKGTGKNILEGTCHFCGATGRYNRPAASFLKFHTCYCEKGDRRNCGLCGKKCHHDSTQIPKVICMP